MVLPAPNVSRGRFQRTISNRDDVKQRAGTLTQRRQILDEAPRDQPTRRRVLSLPGTSLSRMERYDEIWC